MILKVWILIVMLDKRSEVDKLIDVVIVRGIHSESWDLKTHLPDMFDAGSHPQVAEKRPGDCSKCPGDLKMQNAKEKVAQLS